MSTHKDDGGAAFPRPLSSLSKDEVSSDQEGMSLRDAFAIAALQGLLANSYYGNGLSPPLSEANAQEIASMAWNQADEMLKQRSKP